MYFFARSAHPPKYQLTRLMNFTPPSITCSRNGPLQVLTRGGAREEGRGGPTGRVYVADLQVIERNGDICIDFANIGFVNGGGDERGGGDMKISIELTTFSFHVRARPGKMSHLSQSGSISAATRG